MHNDVCMQTWVVHLFVLGGIYLCWICVPRRALVSASSGRTPSGEGDALEQHFVHHFADDRNEDFIERLGTRASIAHHELLHSTHYSRPKYPAPPYRSHHTQYQTHLERYRADFSDGTVNDLHTMHTAETGSHPRPPHVSTSVPGPTVRLRAKEVMLPRITVPLTVYMHTRGCES